MNKQVKFMNKGLNVTDNVLNKEELLEKIHDLKSDFKKFCAAQDHCCEHCPFFDEEDWDCWIWTVRLVDFC